MIKPQFIEMLAAMGDRRFDNLADTLADTTPEVSVRLNPAKEGEKTAIAAEATGDVTWWSEGRYLDSRPRFTSDPALHQGRYYVQDASSMITAAIARRLSEMIAREYGSTVPLLWLDACAAPGGKTTAAIDGLTQGSLVVANEYDPARAEILRENVAKWGYPATVVTRGDATRYARLRETFDIIAVDAPCSGEGMMRKDVTAREQWSPALIDQCSDRQRDILDNLWEALRPGGYLVYSTCTFNTAENELMADRLRRETGAEAVDLGLISDGIDGEVTVEGVAPLHSQRFIPGRVRGEGLFVTILRKPGTLTPIVTTLKESKPKKAKSNKAADNKHQPTLTPDISRSCLAMLDPATADDYALSITPEGEVRAFPRLWSPLLAALLRELQVMSAGVEMATVKGKDLIPAQSLALSTILSPRAFATVALSREEALAYLSRENVTLPADTPRGIILLLYDGYPLGFVKNIGNRANNLYPKEWRIRHNI
ncbi:MAG: hypothetical protein K2L97_02125 [Muribaculaceae bacterium]|nr:hypothetical protein [Muribaculaceae bacterium]